MSDNKLAAQIEADLVGGWYNICRSVLHIQAKYRNGRSAIGLGDIHFAMRPFVNAGRMKQTTGGYAAVVQLSVRPAKKRPKPKSDEESPRPARPYTLASLKTVMAYKPYHQGVNTQRLIIKLLTLVGDGKLGNPCTSKAVHAQIFGHIGQHVKQGLDILVQAGVLTFTDEGKLYAAAPNWQEIAAQHNSWPLPEE